MSTQNGLNMHIERATCKALNFPPFTTPDKKENTEGAKEEGYMEAEDENVAADEKVRAWSK